MIVRAALLLTLVLPAAMLRAQERTDSVMVARTAIERYLVGRDVRPTELSSQLSCLRIATDDPPCVKSRKGRVAPVLRSVADSLGLPLGSPDRIPTCGDAAAGTAGGAQLRIESLHIVGDSAQVGTSLWCRNRPRLLGRGCRYHLVRHEGRWEILPGRMRCFTT